jgi:predicted TPR repeat methyltransferase
LERDRPGALSLAERPVGFDLRDGRHWEYVAEVEENAGRIEAAKEAWRKAVFYYPDDDELTGRAGAFAVKYQDEDLKTALAGARNVLP